MDAAPKKRGRAKLAAGERTRGSLTIRLRDRVRDELETAAKNSGRSLSEEMEYQMELALHHKDQHVERWGDDMFRLADSIANMRNWAENYTDGHWLTDDETFALFRDGIVRLMDNYRARLLVLRRDTPVGPIAGRSRDEVLDALASLSGISPPRLSGSGSNPERDAAERRANVEMLERAQARVKAESKKEQQ